jgi:hypothetical protein
MNPFRVTVFSVLRLSSKRPEIPGRQPELTGIKPAVVVLNPYVDETLSLCQRLASLPKLG